MSGNASRVFLSTLFVAVLMFSAVTTSIPIAAGQEAVEDSVVQTMPVFSRYSNWAKTEHPDGTTIGRFGLPQYVWDQTQGTYVPHIIRQYAESVEIQSGLIGWKIFAREAILTDPNM